MAGPHSYSAPLPETAPQPAELDRLKAENEWLRREVQRLEALADHDVLVPVLNRRAFVRELARAMAFCRRYDAPAALVYLDLDGFKAINDGFGHLAGDAALKRVGEILVGNVRESDTVARLGGDEFAALLYQTDEAGARAKAGLLAERLEAEALDWNGARISLAGSFGVRAFAGQDGPEAWLAEADAAMFVRKRSAR